jgi:hypothetical protein
MKKLCLFILCVLTLVEVKAQSKADSIAYQEQRKKINLLLQERTQKFGQYNVSLTEHTGIFGLQTKKDIRRSNEILMNIVSTDNEIFRQLKILLDYRTSQQEQVQVQVQSKQSEDVSVAYMNTINRLRNQQDLLKKQLAQAQAEQEKAKQPYLIIIGVLIITSILLLLTRKHTAKA